MWSAGIAVKKGTFSKIALKKLFVRSVIGKDIEFEIVQLLACIAIKEIDKIVPCRPSITNNRILFVGIVAGKGTKDKFALQKSSTFRISSSSVKVGREIRFIQC